MILAAHCCRVWPIVACAPLGKCGLCKQRPEVMSVADSEEWLANRPEYLMAAEIIGRWLPSPNHTQGHRGGWKWHQEKDLLTRGRPSPLDRTIHDILELGYIYRPVELGRLYVHDGDHRILAAHRLGIPVPYVMVEGD